jgi:hypothetical protein
MDSNIIVDRKPIHKEQDFMADAGGHQPPGQ